MYHNSNNYYYNSTIKYQLALLSLEIWLATGAYQWNVFLVQKYSQESAPFTRYGVTIHFTTDIAIV